MSHSAAGDVSTHPVALNLRTGSLAIVTGNLWLKLKNIEDTRSIAGEYGLTFSFSNPAMQTAFYQASTGATLRNRLQAAPRVMGITLDMVDRIRRPR